ncbi:YicC/YloC family endoribonuclease [Parachitinimonas caeni]|uniref:YicC family protein n=1 Tax=Parachitinimonas caeni TaxID=3031301 RepID=A0ABT7DT52_9NEIS|nr:YicC/YloC family endoribonuclease [Parachitinimonas caeni]MDK2123257.1 YicC family protein [Parachitinimonas caeni]
MTGFATISRELVGGVLTVELRAVNHRFLDVSLRLPEELRLLENQLREKMAGKVTRGKLDCRVSYNTDTGAPAPLRVDRDYLQSLIALSEQVRAMAPGAGELKLGELLRWPGVMASDALPPEMLQQTCLEMFDAVLTDFVATRRREGEKLVAMMLERVSRMEQLVVEVTPKIPAIVAAYEEKIVQRLKEALGSLDDDRVKQEVALFAQRVDVAEEISRLNAHLSELRRILSAGGSAGKRLDFLMQELHREANTLGSKSVSIETSQISMEMKVLIEQMREQVQNIE